MKKIVLLSSVMLFLMACSGVKKTQEAINSGNYSSAMNKALKNLSDNKTKKGNQNYVLMLEEAFKKNSERELQQISFLKKENNPENLDAIFRSYQNLKGIQERIRPLLPLPIYDENRNAEFSFVNYDTNIINTQNLLSEHLYNSSVNLIENAITKFDYRKAYEDLVYLNTINPEYRDSNLKMDEAHTKGLDYVAVNMVNNTDQIIPRRLEDELLNFNTYGLNDLWTEYHTSPIKNHKYDYEMQLALKDIFISPEKVNERQIIKEKQVKDGFKFARDSDGNIVKDSLGNKIEIDNFKTIKCNFYEFTQFKSAAVTGNVSFTDLKTKQQINSYPLESEFAFEHIYANSNGDRRALDNDLVALLDLAAVPFPTNEQMVYDASEDLKSRLKDILIRQKFN